LPHEIERKFLLSSDAWRAAVTSSTRIRQGFLPSTGAVFVRIRAAGDRATLTIKAPKRGLTRLEYEYPIPLPDAAELLPLCDRPLIDKTRHLVAHAHHTWEIDEFHAANAGLIIAELELRSESEPFDRPPWLGAEVSHDPRYLNVNLAKHPYSTWCAAE
jgi:adenylate cyclase